MEKSEMYAVISCLNSAHNMTNSETAHAIKYN